MKINDFFYKYFLVIAVVFVLLFSLIPRYFGVISGLPDYDITEVPVVGHALSFVQGDLRPTWHKYGPLYSYLLAVVYVLISFLYDINIDVFVQNSFFNPYFYYLTARIFATVLIIILSGAIYFCAKKIYNKEVALIALSLVFFPFVDNIAYFQIRVDVLLAIWALLAVYNSVKIYQTKKVKYYVFIGLFFGLGLATKPLTALLVLPTILLSCFFAQEEKSFLKRVKLFFIDKNIYLFFLFGVFFNFLFNPYSLLNFSDYISSQTEVINSDIFSPLSNASKGYSYVLSFSNEWFLGFFFVLIAIFSLVYYLYSYLKKKDAIFVIIASYPVVYFSAFAFLPIFENILIPIIPVFILMISKFIVDISSSIEKHWLRVLFISVILFFIMYQPGYYLLKKSLELKEHIDNGRGVSTIVAKDWIESNIPKMSKIFIYGHYPNVPRIVDYRSEVHMNIIDDLIYGFNTKPLYLRSYKRAYEKIKEEKDVFYELESRRTMNVQVPEDEIFDFFMENNFDYVIADFLSSLDNYPEFRKRKIKVYDFNDYFAGKSFNIYPGKLFTVYKIKD